MGLCGVVNRESAAWCFFGVETGKPALEICSCNVVIRERAVREICGLVVKIPVGADDMVENLLVSGMLDKCIKTV